MKKKSFFYKIKNKLKRGDAHSGKLHSAQKLKNQEFNNIENQVSVNHIAQSHYSEYLRRKEPPSEKARPKKVAIIEMLNSHIEVIPTLAYLFTKLNYKIDIFLSAEVSLDAPFFLTDTNNINFYCFWNTPFQNAFESYGGYLDYDIIFLNSTGKSWNNISKHFAYLQIEKFSCRDNILSIEHNMRHFDDSLDFSSRQFCLNPYLEEKYMIPYISPVYLQSKKASINKNNTNTSILVIGAIESAEDGARRDYDSLFRAVYELKQSGLLKFNIKIVGSCRKKGEPFKNEIQHTVDKYEINDLVELIVSSNRVSYSDLYSLCTESDFVLPLIHPNKSLIQKAYIESKVSGNINLAIAFNLIPIMNSQVCSTYLLNRCSVCYKNDNVVEGLQRAIQLTDNDVASIKQNISKLREELLDTSLSNLTTMIESLNEAPKPLSR